MTKNDVSWDLCRSFLAVVTEGSLSGAARAMGLTQPTVGRQIASLEQALGVALFVRGQQGLTPTDAALDLVPHAKAMSAAASALERAASGDNDELRGTVRIAASDIVSCEVLPPMLAAFRNQYPAVGMELVSSNRITNLVTREADIAVRMTRPEQSALVAKRIGTVRIGLFAHRGYVERYGLPGSLEQLREHATIGYDTETRSIQNLNSSGIDLQREQFTVRADNDLVQMAAVRAGLGIGGVQVGVAAREPDLVPVLPDAIGFTLDIWLVMHENVRAVRRVRLLFDHLARALQAYCEK